MRSWTRAICMLVVACMMSSLFPSALSAGVLSASMQEGQSVADTKLAMTEAATPAGSTPFFTHGDRWMMTHTRRWTSGFLAGSHWLDYQRTRDASAITLAKTRQAPIASLSEVTKSHDIGFPLMATYGNAYRLTGDARYRDVLVKGARSLATRYDPIVRSVRTSNTEKDFWVYNDTMMNIELLFWGANHGGGRTLRDKARDHALRCVDDFLRPDGSSWHYVAYSEKTGKALDKGQGQGLGKETTWSRGQAWIIYGLAIAYRETGDPRLLRGAHEASDYWIANVPDDLVPYWDFDVTPSPDEPRDSSAAAIVASAFIELSQLDPDPMRRAEYIDHAERTLESLSSSYLAPPANPAVLKHGTFAAMLGEADQGTIWGDYYYREALSRFRTAVRRIPGPDRYSVSIRASQTGFVQSDAVVVASGSQFADALCAGALAGALEAPVLLTDPASLKRPLAEEIARLGATEVVVVGGRSTVSDAVVDSLDALPGVTARRITGRDRYDLSARIAEEIERETGSVAEQVFVVRGDDFADALCVSPLAYSGASPVLLTRSGSLPSQVASQLERSRPQTVTVVGGLRSVSSAVSTEITAITGRGAARIAGTDRYAVSAALAKHAYENGLAEPGFVGVATGRGFADALSGGAIGGSRDGVILLTAPESLHPAARRLVSAHSADTSDVWIFGGETSVSGRTEDMLKIALEEQ